MNVETLLEDRKIPFMPKAGDFVIQCINPDHEDKNPSMRVDQITGIFHCFACGYKGNLFHHFGERTNHLQQKRDFFKKKIIQKRSENLDLSFPQNSMPYVGNWRNIKPEIDNMYHTDYWSDGLIVSTPTGSTGYSLSNGGPIVAPESGIIILNPISPHNINMRPFLINDTSSIKIIVKEKDYSLSLDSRIYSIDKKSILLIKKSDFTINTIECAEDNFFKKLRDRLFWGQDMRNTDSINK